MDEAERTNANALTYLREQKRKYESRLGVLAKPVQFLLVGSTGAVIDLSSLYALTRTTLPWGAARALAIWLATTWVFWFNRHLTFSYARAEHPLGQYLKFCGAYTFGGLVNWLVSMVVRKLAPPSDWLTMIAAVCGILAALVFNFLSSNYLVFRVKRMSTTVPDAGVSR